MRSLRRIGFDILKVKISINQILIFSMSLKKNTKIRKYSLRLLW